MRYCRKTMTFMTAVRGHLWNYCYFFFLVSFLRGLYFANFFSEWHVLDFLFAVQPLNCFHLCKKDTSHHLQYVWVFLQHHDASRGSSGLAVCHSPLLLLSKEGQNHCLVATRRAAISFNVAFLIYNLTGMEWLCMDGE